MSEETAKRLEHELLKALTDRTGNRIATEELDPGLSNWDNIADMRVLFDENRDTGTTFNGDYGVAFKTPQLLGCQIIFVDDPNEIDAITVYYIDGTTEGLVVGVRDPTNKFVTILPPTKRLQVISMEIAKTTVGVDTTISEHYILRNPSPLTIVPGDSSGSPAYVVTLGSISVDATTGKYENQVWRWTGSAWERWDGSILIEGAENIDALETSTPLAAAASFTGSTKTATRYGEIHITAFTDEDGSIIVQQSDSATFADANEIYESVQAVTGGTPQRLIVALSMPYVRVKYTNGGSDQTRFKLRSRLTPTRGW